MPNDLHAFRDAAIRALHDFLPPSEIASLTHSDFDRWLGHVCAIGRVFDLDDETAHLIEAYQDLAGGWAEDEPLFPLGVRRIQQIVRGR